MKNKIMNANIIRIFSFNYCEVQSEVFHRVGNIWQDGIFRRIPTDDLEALIDRCFEIGVDVNITENDEGKTHVMLYVG